MADGINLKDLKPAAVGRTTILSWKTGRGAGEALWCKTRVLAEVGATTWACQSGVRRENGRKTEPKSGRRNQFVWAAHTERFRGPWIVKLMINGKVRNEEGGERNYGSISQSGAGVCQQTPARKAPRTAEQHSKRSSFLLSQISFIIITKKVSQFLDSGVCQRLRQVFLSEMCQEF